MPSILFVCLGNICRSPAAEGILKHLAKKENVQDLLIASCGLGNWHEGKLPDLRIQEAAKRRGIVLSSRAQPFKMDFFKEFDFILAADREVLNTLYRYARTPQEKAKIHLITAFSKSYKDEEIPDPYYEGEAGFELVLDMLEDACEGLFYQIKNKK